ncbi:MAG TPA: hypothetical protein VGF75_01375 [Candidatus Saccharimonadales bacterium]
MSRKHLITRPTKNQDLRFEELSDELEQDYQDKARALQVRRWRALKHEMKRAY